MRLHPFHLNPKARFGDIFKNPVGGCFTKLDSLKVGRGPPRGRKSHTASKVKFIWKWWGYINIPIHPDLIQFRKWNIKQEILSSKDPLGLIQIRAVVSSVRQIGHFYLSRTLHQVRQNSTNQRAFSALQSKFGIKRCSVNRVGHWLGKRSLHRNDITPVKVNLRTT